MKKGIGYTVIFTLIVSFVFILILAFANELTRPITEYNEELALKRAVLNAFNLDYENEQEIIKIYDERIEIKKISGQDLYVIKKDAETLYASYFQGQGLWGPITGILAVNESVTRIVGLEIIYHNETPGLGGRIDEPEFKDQFSGEIVDKNGVITLSRKGVYDKDHKNQSIDSITGATSTSSQLVIIINNQLARLRSLLKGYAE